MMLGRSSAAAGAREMTNAARITNRQIIMALNLATQFRLRKSRRDKIVLIGSRCARRYFEREAIDAGELADLVGGY